MGLTPDIVNENWDAITSWTDVDTDTGVSEISPAGQLRLDTNTGAAGNAIAGRRKGVISPPDKFTIEIRTYFDLVGALADTDYPQILYSTASWRILVAFASDGLYVYKTGGATTEVGTNLVVTGGSAAWQIWRFQVDKSAGEDAATVEVFLDGASQGTVDCDFEQASTDGRVALNQLGYTTNDMVTHIDYIRIATGLGAINDVEKPQLVIF